MEDLLIHKDEINMQMARYGVKFGLYKNGKFKERLFPYDPIPRTVFISGILAKRPWQ